MAVVSPRGSGGALCEPLIKLQCGSEYKFKRYSSHDDVSGIDRAQSE
jgi:hypothetical protein